MLHSDLPSVDTLLKNPEIAQELLQAENLTDIVDSRLALNNLRSLDEQLNERLKEETPVVVDISAGVAGNGTSFGTMAQAVSTAGPGYAVDAGGFLSFMQASGRNTANLLGQPSFANIFSGITAERQAAATDWQATVTGRQATVTDWQATATGLQAAATDWRAAVTGRQAAATDRQAATTRRQAASTGQHAAVTDRQEAATKQGGSMAGSFAGITEIAEIHISELTTLKMP